MAKKATGTLDLLIKRQLRERVRWNAIKAYMRQGSTISGPFSGSGLRDPLIQGP